MDAEWIVSSRLGAEEACRLAERVLRKAVQDTGHMVDGGSLRKLWSELAEGEMPAALVRGRYNRLFKPALHAGRVRSVKHGARVYYGPEESAGLPVPDPRPSKRTYGETVIERCRMAELALAAAVNDEGRMVPAASIRSRMSGVAAGSTLREAGRISRVLAPAIEMGRVRCEEVGGHCFYAPADALVTPPLYVSDSARIRKAVERATAKHDSRVPLESVQEEVNADPELTLETNLTLGQMLPMLRSSGSIVGSRWGEGGRVYYALPEGPRSVRVAAMTDLDKRRKVVQRRFRDTGGRPFTTRSCARYARANPKLGLSNDPPWAWTAALQNLEQSGEIVGISVEHHRARRWAPAGEWSSLTDTERAQRLVDCRPHSRGVNVGSDDDGALSILHGTGDISRNDDVRAYLLRRRERLAECMATEGAARLVLARPLSTRELIEGVPRGPDRNMLRQAIYEASRLREDQGMQSSAIIEIGRVGNRAYWDIQETPEGVAYVRFLAAMRAARSLWIKKDLDDLAANVGDPLRTEALGPVVIWAQREMLLKRILFRKAELEEATVSGRLLTDEIAASRRETQQLSEWAERVEKWRPGTGDEYGESSLYRPVPEALGSDEQVLDIAVAAEALYRVRLVGAVDRRLTARLTSIRPIMLDTPLGAQSGRPVERAVDRIDVLSYAGLLGGGSGFTSFVGRGYPALGRIRACGPFTATLMSPHTGAHVASAIALGLLDTTDARSALGKYITQHMDGQPQRPLPAVEAAVYGLAPSPFFRIARSLTDGEDAVLERVSEKHPDRQLRDTAARVLQAWREQWTDLRILREL